VPQGTINEQQMRLLQAKRMDGLILSGWPTFPQFQELLKMDLPLVVINDYLKNIPTNFVYADHFNGGYLAGKHFAQLGYRDIAVTTPKPEWFPDMDQRLKGFKQALKEEGVDLDKTRIISAGVTEESGYQAMLKLLQNKNYPRAIFFMNDVTAIGALKALKEKRVPCPEQMAILGYDDTHLSQYVSPTLSTIHQPVFEMAQEASHLLVHLIEKGESRKIKKKFPTSLVVRESCGSKRNEKKVK